MKKLVQYINWKLSKVISNKMYYYGEASFEANQAMQEPLEKLYKYENQPDMREKVKEYISELNAEIDRCHKKIEELSYDEICKRENKSEINYYFARREALSQVKNDLQGRLDELI